MKRRRSGSCRLCRCLCYLLLLIDGALSTTEKDERTSVGLVREVRKNVTRLIPVSSGASDELITDPDIAAVREFFNELFDVEDRGQGTNHEEGRTFGVKRLQFMFLPMMYKMGVMMTMLGVLTVISLKGLLIGLILLMLKLSSFFAKFHSGWQHESHHSQSWAHSPQPVHVHVHNGGPHQAHGQAYSGYSGFSGASGPGVDDQYYYQR